MVNFFMLQCNRNIVLLVRNVVNCILEIYLFKISRNPLDTRSSHLGYLYSLFLTGPSFICFLLALWPAFILCLHWDVQIWGVGPGNITCFQVFERWKEEHCNWLSHCQWETLLELPNNTKEEKNLTNLQMNNWWLRVHFTRSGSFTCWWTMTTRATCCRYLLHQCRTDRLYSLKLSREKTTWFVYVSFCYRAKANAGVVVC